MTPQQRTFALASIVRSPDGKALGGLIQEQLERASKVMLTTNDTNALLSARGAVLALSTIADELKAAPAKAETLRTQQPT